MNALIFIAYYLYAAFMVGGTAYLVFYKGISAWWFLLTLVLLETTPSIKSSEKEKEQKPLNRVSDKQRVRIRANKSYYKLVLETKPHICENCGERIINASGRNVSHILSGGSNPALYHDEENNYLLCDLCEHVWTNGDKTKMRIYPDSEEISSRLKLKYYTNQ